MVVEGCAKTTEMQSASRRGSEAQQDSHDALLAVTREAQSARVNREPDPQSCQVYHFPKSSLPSDLG